ncbi:hypothetical protein [Fluviispira multicolorata]|uniref:Subtilase family protein n=1 Tax=Fluviispira multicolorata TaxID=2654512 RepID=A0A833N1Q9_9BACT|nr:hypothetical protein [Fluviispira multicolorata]KAB8031040.1 hypothetical protein GCL57_08725 [Fluviispira multicolorata]
MNKNLCLSILILIISCRNNNSSENLSNWQPPEDAWRDPNPALTNKINEEIYFKLSNITVPCSLNNTNQNCQLIDIHPNYISDIEGNKESEGLRVLIIDDSSMRLAAYTRFRKRVFLNLLENSEGSFLLDKTTIKIPYAAKNILIDILNKNEYEKFPSELLVKNKGLFNRKISGSFDNLIFNKNSGHGLYIFNYIANNSPKSQFILAYMTQEKFSNILNETLDADILKREIDLLFRKQSDELKKYIESYKIDFISLSYGISVNYLDNFFPHLTSQIKNYIIASYYKNFIDNILYNNNVILVQAGDNSITPNPENNPGYLADCTKNTRRLRVSFVKDLSFSIPFFGTKDLNLIKGKQKNFIPCTDIYINFSVGDVRPYIYNKGVINFSSYNIGTLPITITDASSSNATPVAVTYLLFLKTLNPLLSNYELMEQVNILKGNSFVILDPSLHKQLPIYKLGYLN